MELAIPTTDTGERADDVVRRRLRDPLGLALLAPSLVFLAVFTYWPTLQVLWQSFGVGTRGAPAAFGTRNYQLIVADPAFRRALWNNLQYAVGTIVPSLVLALGLALVLNRSTRISTVLRSIFFLPVLIPLVAAASVFLFVFLPGVGLLDYYLAKLGIQGANWLGDPDVALYSITALTVWKNAGYYMLFFLAGLQAVPEDVMEAAHLDGAGPYQRFRHIILPELRPTFLFVTVIASLQAVTQVDHVFVMTKGGPSNATNLVLFYIYEQAVEHYDVGKASAATLLSLAVLMGLTAVSFRSLASREGGP